MRERRLAAGFSVMQYIFGRNENEDFAFTEGLRKLREIHLD